MKTLRIMVAAFVVEGVGTSVSAQSFNVDISTTIGTMAPAPGAAFGGAASQVGFWNNIATTTVGPFALNNLAGAATGVTVTRSSGAGGTFSFNNVNTSGDFELLLDDGQDIGAPAAAAVTYTLNNLAAGVYDVYTYAVAPDSATFITSTVVGGGAPQNVGGAIPVNAFAAGVTHSVHSGINHAGGNMVMTFDCITGFGTVNGFQVVLVPAPGALALLGVAGLIGGSRRRRA